MKSFALISLLASPAFATGSPDGLTGIIRMPAARVAMGSSAFWAKSGAGASFTYPLFSGLEAGLTRRDGNYAFHGKLLLLPEGPPGESWLPALAAGVQDWRRDFGPRRYFWVASKRLWQEGLQLHAGLHRPAGFFEGNASWFGGIELPLANAINLKAEYDSGRASGSAGIEVRLGDNLVAYDHVLDLFGSGPAASNLVGLSYQNRF